MKKMARKMVWQKVKTKFKNLFISKKNRSYSGRNRGLRYLPLMLLPLLSLIFLGPGTWIIGLVVVLAITLPFFLKKKE